MNFTDVNEPVKAAAVFEGGKILPKWFVRKGRKYIVKRIDFIWNEKQGMQEFVNFSIAADTLSAELSFNKKLLTWHIKKIITE